MTLRRLLFPPERPWEAPEDPLPLLLTLLVVDAAALAANMIFFRWPGWAWPFGGTVLAVLGGILAAALLVAIVAAVRLGRGR